MRHICIITLLLALFSWSVNAQTLTNSERRMANSQILTVIEDYERFSSLYDDEAEYYFETLFANDSKVTVFCDMLGMPSYLKDVSLKEYIQMMRTQSQNTNVTIKDVVKGDMKYNAGMWEVPVYFRKSISYIDQGGYVFSVEDYYHTDFNIMMNLCYNPDTGRCLINSIKGKIVSEKVFPVDRFAIIEKPVDVGSKDARYLSGLTIDGEPLQYNQYGCAIVQSGDAQVEDPDVEVFVKKNYEGYNYDVLSFGFKPRNTRLRARYGLAPLAYSIKSSHKSVSGKSFAQEFALDWGQAFFVNERSKMSFNIGAGLSWSSVKLSYNPELPISSTFSYVEKDDNAFHKKQEINYTFLSASESMKYVDAFVPVYFEFEHLINKSLIFNWNLGVKTYLSLSADVDEVYTVNAYINGDTENVVSLYTDPKTNSPYFIDPGSYAKNSFDLSAFANMGVDVDVYKKRLYAMVRLGYEFGLLQSYKSDNQYDYLQNNRMIVYDPMGDKHIAVNSMISGLNFRRSSLWISFGVKFKM